MLFGESDVSEPSFETARQTTSGKRNPGLDLHLPVEHLNLDHAEALPAYGKSIYCSTWTQIGISLFSFPTYPLRIKKPCAYLPSRVKMSVDMEWIDLSKDHHGNRETRVKVRSHAMRATAASRRKNIAWGKRNLRQLPADLVINEATRAATVASNEKAYTDVIDSASQTVALSVLPGHFSWATNISPNMPLSGLELLAAEIGIHVLDLSALTEIQCGWTACAILASQRSCISGLVSRRQPSYLYCVASRYGYNPYLDEALRCVAIRAKRVLAPSCQAFEESESRQYASALHGLQVAIDSVEERNRPEVLCAINLLSLFEV